MSQIYRCQRSLRTRRDLEKKRALHCSTVLEIFVRTRKITIIKITKFDRNFGKNEISNKIQEF